MSSKVTVTPRMPLAYRAIFVILDIALPVMGIAFNLLDPLQALANFTPHPTSPINLETHVLLDCTSGFFAALIFINVYLLVYRPNDLVVWKGLVGGVLLQDLFMIRGFLLELSLRNGGVAVANWSGQDWGNVVGYSVIALVRALFVAGVGLNSSQGVKDRKKA